MNENAAVPETNPQKTHEPQFIGKLKGKDVKIILHSGEEVEGKIVKYNRYEILFLEHECIIPILLMKNFIAMIVPDGEENPFEKKSIDEPAATPEAV